MRLLRPIKVQVACIVQRYNLRFYSTKPETILRDCIHKHNLTISGEPQKGEII